MAVEAARFGRYRVTGTLGAGGMGEVYAAVDDVLGREVAVKTLRGKHSGLAARLLDERFRQEARAIAQLAHPGVVAVFDLDLSAETPYLVMERVAGPSLKERIAQRRLDPTELRTLGIQIARALATAHAAGVVHRDVKPANILSANDGMWKLADFGVAHVPDSSLTMTGQFMGSPAYAAPEALLRGQCVPAGDVFGLGASLYEAALGRWPRAEATTGALLAPVQPLRELAPDIPAGLAHAIDRALAIEPDARPTPSQLADLFAAGEVVPVAAPVSAAIAAVPLASLGNADTVSVLPLAAPAAPAPIRWKPWAIGSGAVILLILIIAAATGSGSPSSAATSAPARDSANADKPPPPPRKEPVDPNQPVEIRAVPPPNMDRKAAKDWNKIVDKLYEQQWGEARKKLAEFERKFGESEQSKSLREQLAALPAGEDHDD